MKTKEILEKVFNIIYFLAGCFIFIGGIFHLFLRNLPMALIGIILGGLIIYIGYKNLKASQNRRYMNL